MKKNTIAFVFAHPDDESFACASTIRELVVRGNHVVLCVATLGEAGKTGRLGPMTKEELAAKRKQELQKAADVMGIFAIHHLNYPDGKLASIDRYQLVNDIVTFLNDQQAQIVITFSEDGISGHPDHTAIHHATREAILSGECPTVQKLYYVASRALKEAGHSPTVKFDSQIHWEVKVKALLAHESQIGSVKRVFGDLQEPLSGFRFESFVLAWERGVYWPNKKETFLTDDR
ncbi:PIG-L family deacetylase [Aneurinibacillus thermoaerophilus]|uniref:N-acetylglucosaminyl deacetylase, LmbE family n=1 Tax=Aneurinibacillus thermoaerophilus TaxID=143495 RepID=A0A1G7X725_ANETH|nr:MULTISPECIES: PIG-L deacetylase family protein [Aneurinibacillus]AMA73233.1 GlcNAc-PI de-N-acetylase [Aneurinibacillus sp. XH2]MED0674339.1 PIG-L family deacetylase [Aneurinibacillus thermoaerophilus]MED0678357.1 PIG-L family deacetylase [Aneurinibacillus thermoaerophilus]MED0756962.1 PIG-L family deacetylase [Aneurinibacillus thermoaerophilus]MED0761733.1 PIG-L family deacetylase [Aneurinibacillus thermoaerophilus]